MSERIDPAVAAAGAQALSARLRDATRPDHARVDAAFGRFDLTSRTGYAAFLMAQARVLPALEAALRPDELVPRWRGRTSAIRADLAAMGLSPPPPHAPDLPDGEAARWGALYVLEGSRLGGAVLGRDLPPGLPAAFLGAIHPPGAWRETLALLDAANRTEAAQDAAIGAARAVFAAYERSAAQEAEARVS